MRYFITFTCYGTHMHGDEAGSVDRNHNQYEGRMMEADPQRFDEEWKQMDQAPYLLDAHSQTVVLAAIREVCQHRAWGLLAAHVRKNHVHAVVEAETPPEKIMNDFKAYASRKLNQLGRDEPDRKRWARHGSTRWLWNDEDVRGAIHYVVEEQGEAMAVFLGERV